MPATSTDWMRQALTLARKAYGETSPNPMVGAVLVKGGKVIGKGWHHRAGEPHAEIEALRDARAKGHNPAGATLYVTLEPCCTHGRTPPCSDAIIAAKISRVVSAATDPNPAHSGKGYRILRRASIKVQSGVMAQESNRLNEAFNHWISKRTPFVIVKAAMTLDGKIATSSGESKWITGPKAREQGMLLRKWADAVLVGVNTILADDPQLTFRTRSHGKVESGRHRLRVILDTHGRTPLNAHVVKDEHGKDTIIVVGKSAPRRKIAALARRVRVLHAPERKGRIDLRWLLKKLGAEGVTALLVEGGGEVNASFLFDGLAHRIAFFYAPKILGGREARKAVAGDGVPSVAEALNMSDVEWRKVGDDLMLTARVGKRLD